MTPASPERAEERAYEVGQRLRRRSDSSVVWKVIGAGIAADEVTYAPNEDAIVARDGDYLLVCVESSRRWGTRVGAWCRIHADDLHSNRWTAVSPPNSEDPRRVVRALVEAAETVLLDRDPAQTPGFVELHTAIEEGRRYLAREEAPRG